MKIKIFSDTDKFITKVFADGAEVLFNPSDSKNLETEFYVCDGEVVHIKIEKIYVPEENEEAEIKNPILRLLLFLLRSIVITAVFLMILTTENLKMKIYM